MNGRKDVCLAKLSCIMLVSRSPLCVHIIASNAHACVAQIFGKVMVCKDLPTAHKVANRAHHLNFVTIKGEQVSKKGTITGGYIDQSRWVGSAQQ